ncbi:MAG: heme o synthase [Anaerolineae bacterium]|nr:heme o synthase [Anaerolineae bacterium]
MLAYATPVSRREVKVARKAAVEAIPTTSLKTTISAYVALAKPRVISLLLLTTWAAMWIASPTPPSLALVFWTLLGGALAAGGANAINMYYDRDIDVLMGRTARRPLPSHRLEPYKALWFGVALGVLSFVSLTVFVNLLSAVLALAGLLFYVFIYTAWLKRTSTQNIVIGGAAGAVPPLVGWAAVTGQLSLIPVYLFIIVFFWTPPHFWALALVRQGDYSRAGVPMLPCVVGERETYKQILIYSVVLVALSVVFGPLSGMGSIYLALALLLGGIFIWDAVKLAQQGGAAPAWKLYKYSLLYLALLFVAMMLDHSLAGSLPASLTAFLRP